MYVHVYKNETQEYSWASCLWILLSIPTFLSCTRLSPVLPLNLRITFINGSWGILDLKKIHPLLVLFFYKQGDWTAWIGYLSLPPVSLLSLFTTYKNTLQTIFHIIFRAYPWSEDWNSEKGRSAVFHEDVYGLKEIIYLPYEVSVRLRTVIWYKKN